MVIAWFLPGDQAPRLPRGDVAIDAAVADSLARGHGFWTPWERGSLFRLQEDTGAFGFPADQHPPLWPLAGAALMRIFKLDPLAALEWMSLIAHLFTLGILVRIGRRSEGSPWPALAWAIVGAGSAFSFNGSLYAAQAALYLLAADRIARPNLRPPAALFLGIVLGAAYLLNYQAALLIPAFLLARWTVRRGKLFAKEGLLETAFVLGSFALVAAPWWIRNLSWFGQPFYSVNPLYFLSKTGAVFSHNMVDGAALLEAAPHPLPAFLAGLLRCAYQNIPFLLLLVIALFPGCLAACMARIKAIRSMFVERERDSLLTGAGLILALHLMVCLAWPAVKVRYLVPAGPLMLVLAWRAVMPALLPKARRANLVFTVGLGLVCAAIAIKGSVHGQRLLIAFLLGYLPLGLVLFLAIPAMHPNRVRLFPGICLGFLLAAAGGVLPGQAYFNLPPWPDFFGENKEAMEQERAAETVKIAETLKSLGCSKAMGDITLWHALPGLELTTPPKSLPGETYPQILRQVAGSHSLRYAQLERSMAPDSAESWEMKAVWKGKHWVLLDLFP